MLRRPPGEGTVANRVILAIVILLVPWLIDAKQQQQQGLHHGYKSPHEAVKPDALHTLEATRLSQAQQLETPLIADRRKSTQSTQSAVDKQQHNYYGIAKNDASALATLAPANSAVRAPPARRSSIGDAGLSSPQIARSLEDWEVEDFVLLATVDGKLYARDRKTGKERWTLELDTPMVDATYYRRNRSIVEEDYRAVDDYLWIVEPSRDGSLFVYIPGGEHPGLVKTGLTMKKLVDEMIPYADKENEVLYTGDKKTTIITLDARSGKVLKWVGSTGALVNNDQSCVRNRGLLDPDNDECSTTGTLTLGRTEYTVAIASDVGHQIATLKYSEWGPNNYDHDLHRQYRQTLDKKYVYSNYDGSIFAYDLAQTKERRLFNQKFSSPVARVFDVARPWGSENKDPDLVVLPQPLPPLQADDDHITEMRNHRIFLNHTEDGSWYAMSGNSYPMIIDGPEQAKCDIREWWQQGPLWEALDESQRSKALVGLHSINDNIRPSRPAISGGDSIEIENETMTPGDSQAVEERVISFMDRVRDLPRLAITSLVDFLSNPIMTIVIVGLLLLYNKDLTRWARSNYKTKLQPYLPSAISDDATDILPAEPQGETLRTAKETVLEVVSSQEETEDGETLTLSKTTSSTDDKTPSGAMDSGDTPQPVPDKKKAHRGRRGGVKHRKPRATSEDPAPTKLPPTVEDAVRDAQKLGEGPTNVEPDVQTLPNGVAEVTGPILRLNSLEVDTDKLIGTGSNGTMVFEGKFDGRDVAVKRMLIQFYDIASQETKLLRESDDHPNVIRYFAQQQSAGFLYIALELCPASLADVIEKPHLHRDLAQGGEKDLPNVLYQITNGLQHLHSLRIVHRDLKPQNILVANGKDGRPRLLVSDFGLCKKLEGEQSSFRATTAHAAGTSGWRAPELLLDDDIRDGSTTAIDASTHSGSGVLVSPELMPNRRATRAIDIFSLGLVFFYVLTKGSHPFDCGDRYMREVNIRKGNYNLRPLEVLGDFTYEAKDLIASMLEQEPKRRPSARQVMAHPFFWSSKKRLNFLCDVSDHFEKEKRDPPSPALQELEKWAPEVCCGDFLKLLGKDFVESMGKQRKYTATRLLDLLRALRNKKNHYEDMSDKLKKDVGPLPEGYLSFWTRRFPNLLITCWNIVYEVQWENTDRFHEFYEPAAL